MEKTSTNTSTTSSSTNFKATATLYTLSAVNGNRTKATLEPSSPSSPSYTCDLSYWIKDIGRNRKQHGVVLRSSTNEILGTGDFDFFTFHTPIHLCFGDPDRITKEDSQTEVVWESMTCNSKAKMNNYSFSYDFGPQVGRKTFEWRRTHEGGKIGPIAKKLDFLNLKMVEKETGEVMAKFVHYPYAGWRRGEFEIGKGDWGEEEWKRVVLLSGLMMLDYFRKIWGYSF